ncbi:MAG: hypothetical protein M1820_002895 [Bogoriella megaspora]|nr:MAG: hypothetical protein M1820_002895 [Bogoriella megaspora]
MADTTPQFNELLREHGATPIQYQQYDISRLDEFLKEAYSINSRLAELNNYLRSIRQAYLSATHPPRRKQAAHNDSTDATRGAGTDRRYLTDEQRTEIDAEAKRLLRDLNATIKRLSDTEQQRQSIQTQVALKKRSQHGLGALGRWAAGGAITAKSQEETLDEDKANTLSKHRDSVVWFLQRQLEVCVMVQSAMMEARLTREMEKNKSILYKASGNGSASLSATVDTGIRSANGSISRASAGSTYQPTSPSASFSIDSEQQQLEPEQLQMFEEENKGMLKHYEDTLDQVRHAERSLLEISELQTTLANNLAVQSAHIDQLVQDSEFTEENVGMGNKQLKKATERKSTARFVFYSTSVFCLSLILWDLFV